MDATLLAIVASRKPAFKVFLDDQGIQTCSDLKYSWESGKQLLATYEATIGKLPSDEAFQLLLIYTLAASQAHVATGAQIRAIVDERESVIPGRPAMRLEEAPQVQAPVRARSVITPGLTERMPNLIEAASSDPHTAEQARREMKTQALFQFAVEHLVDLQELGLSWKALNDPARMQALRESLMACTLRLSVERLGALTSAIRRWVRFAEEQDYSVRTPTPLQLSEFLRKVGNGGPTASSSMFQALKWFEQNMGTKFHTEHYLIRPHRFHHPTHSGVQKAELEPWEFINLLLIAANSRGTKQLLVAFLLQSAVSCVRFEHFQRSTLTGGNEDWLQFCCSQGKSRKKGARPKYDWAMPEVPYKGFSLVAIMRDFLKHEALPTATYMWPALVLSAEDLWQVSDTTPFSIAKPMSRARYLELLRGILIEVGLPRESAMGAGYNRLRRFLPTLGSCLQFQPDSLQAIGNWQETPASGGPAPTWKPQRATMPMGLHYAGQKVARSAQIKQHALDCFMRLWRQKQPELSLNHEGLLAPDSWSWQEVCATAAKGQFQKVEELPSNPGLAAGAIEVEPGALADIEKAEDAPALPVDEESDISDFDGFSGSTSPSASDVSADGEDLVGIIPPDDVTEKMPWFQQGAKVHVLRGDDLQGRKLPWCRDAAFFQDPQKVGEGLDNMDRTQICQRCLGRMPRGLYAALSEQCGWLH